MNESADNSRSSFIWGMSSCSVGCLTIGARLSSPNLGLSKPAGGQCQGSERNSFRAGSSAGRASQTARSPINPSAPRASHHPRKIPDPGCAEVWFAGRRPATRWTAQTKTSGSRFFAVPSRARRIDALDRHLDACASCQELLSLCGRTSLMRSAESAGAPEQDGSDSRLLKRGDSVGRYLLLERVGAGAMGTVYVDDRRHAGVHGAGAAQHRPGRCAHRSVQLRSRALRGALSAPSIRRPSP